MYKFNYWICIILWTFMPKTCLAYDVVNIELSDVIKEARETQMKVAKSQIEQNVAQTKQQFNTNTVQGEQTIQEKLNPEEIMPNAKKP